MREQEHYQLSVPNLYVKEILRMSTWTYVWMIQLELYLGGPFGRPLGRVNGYINAGNVGKIISSFVQLKSTTTVEYL